MRLIFPGRKYRFRRTLRKVDAFLSSWEQAISVHPLFSWLHFRSYSRKADLLHHRSRKKADEKLLQLSDKLEKWGRSDRVSASDYLKLKGELEERGKRIKGLEKNITSQS